MFIADDYEGSHRWFLALLLSTTALATVWLNVSFLSLLPPRSS